MADVYASITEADPALVRRIADVLELRAADPRQREMHESYLRDITFPAHAAVLDVGCGTGAITRALATWPGVGDVVGIDPSLAFLARARELNPPRSVTFVEGDARALTFDAATFDVVVFHTTLCHVPTPEAALREARRVLRPDGWLAVFDGDYATTTVAIAPADPLQACADAWVGSSVHDPWLMRRLVGLLDATGFQLTRMRSHGYVETTAAEYIPTIVDRGATALANAGTIGAETAATLMTEARRRITTGQFFGHIAYVSLVARVPPPGEAIPPGSAEHE